MATYHGNAGSVTFAASAIGELTSWSLETSVPLADDTAMGDVWTTALAGGPASWTGSATAHLDYGDTAQAAMVVDIMAATPSGDSVALVFLVATGKTFVGNGIINSISITQNRTDVVDITFTFTGNGQIIPSWA